MPKKWRNTNSTPPHASQCLGVWNATLVAIFSHEGLLHYWLLPEDLSSLIMSSVWLVGHIQPLGISLGGLYVQIIKVQTHQTHNIHTPHTQTQHTELNMHRYIYHIMIMPYDKGIPMCFFHYLMRLMYAQYFHMHEISHLL